jgi:hypothetical protein
MDIRKHPKVTRPWLVERLRKRAQPKACGVAAHDSIETRGKSGEVRRRLRRFKGNERDMPTNPAAVPESKAGALYLSAVERELQPGIYKELIESARRQGSEYSKIWDLFAF